MIQIEIDQDVFEVLKERAEPFVDTPNSVLRRVLGLAEVENDASSSSNRQSPPLTVIETPKRRRRDGRSRTKRAPAGSLLPEAEYVAPILRVIAEKGGRAPAREVIDGVGVIVDERLTSLDKERMANGAIRWHNRVQFTRLRMVDQGLLKKGSPRGVWEITDEGAQQLSSESAA
jgi:hypothetical protein